MHSMNIYVGNLSLTVTEAELRQEFAPFGEVESVTIMNDDHFGSAQPRGYAFIEMPSLKDGAIAISCMNGKLFKGKLMSVIEAMPLSPEKSREGRGRAKIKHA